jgi:hypothetical protein
MEKKCKHSPDFYFEIESATGSIRKIISDIKTKSSLIYPKDISMDMSMKRMKSIAEQCKNYSKNVSILKACEEYAKTTGFEYVIMTEDIINASYSIDENLKNMNNKSVFKAWSSQTVDSKNGGYKHIIQDKTLYLEKNGIKMELNDDEVMQMLKALGIATSDFQRGFKY